jgi:signal transduction histidine kinase
MAQLAHADHLHDAILRAVDDVVLVLDANQRIILCNPAALALLGAQIEGQTLMAALRQPDLEGLLEDARLVGGEGLERRIEYDKLIFQVRALVLADDQRAFEILILRDVTEIQRLERARREMVSNITHELATPISAIGLLADTLLDATAKDKPKRTRKLATDIRRETDTLTQLVQEMRDLSLIESGQMPVRLTACDLRDIVAGSVDPLRALAENKAQTITLDVPPGLRVLADETQLQRAFKNIIHNAVKFAPQGGQIHISVSTTSDEAIVAIRDNGPGIPAADLPRIFERFFQVDRARRNGTGLGLAIVRHIVLAHGGRAWAESVEGQGATFYVALVLAEPDVKEP